MTQFKLRRAAEHDLAACGQMANGSTIEQYYFSQPGAFQRAVDKAFAAELLYVAVDEAEKGMAEMSKVYDETGRELYMGAGDREHD